MHRLSQPSNLLDSDDDDVNDKFGRNSNRFMKSNQNNFQRELSEKVKNRRTPSPKEIETDSEVEIDASNDYDTKDTFGLQTGFMQGSTWRNKNSLNDTDSNRRSGRGLYKQDKLIEEKENEYEFNTKPQIKSRKSLKKSNFQDDLDDFNEDRSIGRWDMQKKELRSKQNHDESEDKFEDWSNSLKSNSSNSKITKKSNEPKKRFQFDSDNDDEIEDPFSSKSSKRFMKSKKPTQDEQLNSFEHKPRKERSKAQFNKSIDASDSDNERESFSRKSKQRDSSDFELRSSTKFISDNNQNSMDIEDPFLSKPNKKERVTNKSIFQKDNDQYGERDFTGLPRSSSQKSRTSSGENIFKKHEESEDEYSPRNRGRSSPSSKFMTSKKQKDNEKEHFSSHKSPRMSEEKKSDRSRGNVKFQDDEQDRIQSKGKRRDRSLQNERPISPDTSMCEEIEVIDTSEKSKPDPSGRLNVKTKDSDIMPRTETSKLINNGISEVAGSQKQNDKTIPPNPVKERKKKDKYQHVTPRVSTLTNIRSISMSNLTGRQSDDGFGTMDSARPYGDDDASGFKSCQSIREAAFINWYLSKMRDGKLNSSRQKQLESMTDEEKAAEELRRKKEKEEEGKRAYDAWMKEKKALFNEQNRKKKESNKQPETKDRKSAETAFEMWKKRKEMLLKEEAVKKKENEQKEKDKKNQERNDKLKEKKEKDILLKAKNKEFHLKLKEEKELQQKAKEEKEKEIKNKKLEAEDRYFQWEKQIEKREKAKKEFEEKKLSLVANRKAWRPNSAKVPAKI